MNTSPSIVRSIFVAVLCLILGAACARTPAPPVLSVDAVLEEIHKKNYTGLKLGPDNTIHGATECAMIGGGWGSATVAFFPTQEAARSANPQLRDDVFVGPVIVIESSSSVVKPAVEALLAKVPQ